MVHQVLCSASFGFWVLGQADPSSCEALVLVQMHFYLPINQTIWARVDSTIHKGNLIAFVLLSRECCSVWDYWWCHSGVNFFSLHNQVSDQLMLVKFCYLNVVWASTKDGIMWSKSFAEREPGNGTFCRPWYFLCLPWVNTEVFRLLSTYKYNGPTIICTSTPSQFGSILSNVLSDPSCHPVQYMDGGCHVI